MQPSVGRIVWYTLHAFEGGEPRVRPALVTEVIAADYCCLSVFLTGDDPEQHSVTYPQPQPVLTVRAHYRPGGEPGGWRWPERD